MSLEDWILGVVGATKFSDNAWENLQGDAVFLHYDVYGSVCRVFGQTNLRQVYSAKLEDRCCGKSLRGYPVILVNSSLANLERGIDPKKRFKATLFHEYTHQVFDEKYRTQIQTIVENSDKKEKKSHLEAINEAFAFWLEEEETEMVCLGYHNAEHYKKNGVDVDTLKSVYSLLKFKCEEKGKYYVVDNLGKIIEENIDKLDKIKLHPNLDKYKGLFDQMKYFMIGEQSSFGAAAFVGGLAFGFLSSYLSKKDYSK